MHISWSQEKNEWLILNRDISFEEITEKLLSEDYVDILEHPKKENQQYFILYLKEYTWVVPFVLEQNGIFLKTAFPSRKFHKKYGAHYESRADET